MSAERTADIMIGDEQHTLLLTTRATKEIAGRYGGLENLGDKLMKSENFEMALGEIVWLLTEEEVELLTGPVDIAGYKTAITEALYKGARRNVGSEADPKNAVVG